MQTPTARCARRTFWTLLATAGLAMGALTNALKAGPGPLTSLAVAVSGAIVLLALALACRIMIAIDHAHRRAGREGS